MVSLITANQSDLCIHLLNQSRMNGKILELFMKENDAWDDMITRQKKEIPDLENMVSAIMKDRKNLDGAIAQGVNLLKHEMHEQENTMTEIKAELAKQQDFLASESKGNSYPIHTLLSQNALRERIRNAERRFLDLKCNYLNYLANAL
jgi:predicted RNase H-like nuclease (RuvC/YqgF family)